MLLNQLSEKASPLNEQQVQRLKSAVADLSPTQLAWVSGFLAAVSSQVDGTTAQHANAGQKLTILYASQTGNAKGVAEKVKSLAQQQSVSVTVANVADYKPKALKNETHVLMIASTHGEGDPPDDAIEFHEFLHSKKAPKLDNLKYSVLALGDTSYEFFCKTGADFDERFAALGATRVAERVDCDVDYDELAADWGKRVVEKIAEELKESSVAETGQVINLPVAGNASQYDKQHPFASELLTSLKITGRDSTKDIRHIEFSLEGSDLTYRPGDSLGIWFENDEALVDEILRLVEIDGSSIIEVSDEKLSIKQALQQKYELTQSYPNFVQQYAELSSSEELKKLVEDKTALRHFIAENQIIDVIKIKPVALTPEQLQAALRKITPRLYSIASSQMEVEDEVHLTVAAVRFDKNGEARSGGASGYLADRLEEGTPAHIFIESNDNFRLPENGDTPVIMIGPGTGIAPFRAFIQQRDANDEQGKNWLFFGNPHFTQDFLYQLEWQDYIKRGVLNKIDLAFSRDQDNKIYVQDRIREKAAELWAWLEQGAHLYVCGDKDRMAKDVHRALVDVIAEQGGKSTEDAENYLAELKKAKRYQKDVY